MGCSLDKEEFKFCDHTFATVIIYAHISVTKIMGFLTALDCGMWIGVRIRIDFPDDVALKFTLERILRVIHVKKGKGFFFYIGARILSKIQNSKVYFLRTYDLHPDPTF